MWVSVPYMTETDIRSILCHSPYISEWGLLLNMAHTDSVRLDTQQEPRIHSVLGLHMWHTFVPSFYTGASDLNPGPHDFIHRVISRAVLIHSTPTVYHAQFCWEKGHPNERHEANPESTLWDSSHEGVGVVWK